MSLLKTGKHLINKFIHPLGLEINKIDKGTSTALYEDRKRPETPKYLNIGAGSFFHPYWHNLDNPNEYYKDDQKGNLNIQYDLTSHESMPLGDNTLEVAYTSHVIEHLSDDDVEFLFSEVYRCLKPGGVFRVTCPDMGLEYDAYIRGDVSFWKWPNAYGTYNTSIEQKFLDHFATALTDTHPASKIKLSDREIREIFLNLPKAEAFDSIIGQIPKDIQKDHYGDHINWFDSEKVTRMLKASNFSEVYESKYLQSRCPILRNKALFDSTCPELSMYIECRK
ncbi:MULTISPECIES: class I SAM-dependent methyltransferase [Pseudomonas fluorescens group]|uniref:class I SAM-dependent methyltransferase n=1 Tax=Pseudomonas fluorescens group TaxID=136843 RepID=UPI00114717D4|nr:MULTISPECIES: methyltransferase domain-containing protein [Pseudomonas fluorescens group]QDH64225.1 methyltransferase domain-containing protein [Pseudomonas azotoformans]